MPARLSRLRKTLRSRRRHFEQLEDRRLMAVDLQLVNDTNPEFSDGGAVSYPDRDKAFWML